MIKFSLAAQKLAHISPTADFDSSVKYGPRQREERGRELTKKEGQRVYTSRWHHTLIFWHLIVTTLILVRKLEAIKTIFT